MSAGNLKPNIVVSAGANFPSDPGLPSTVPVKRLRSCWVSCREVDNSQTASTETAELTRPMTLLVMGGKYRQKCIDSFKGLAMEKGKDSALPSCRCANITYPPLDNCPVTAEVWHSVAVQNPSAGPCYRWEIISGHGAMNLIIPAATVRLQMKESPLALVTEWLGGQSCFPWEQIFWGHLLLEVMLKLLWLPSIFIFMGIPDMWLSLTYSPTRKMRKSRRW